MGCAPGAPVLDRSRAWNIEGAGRLADDVAQLRGAQQGPTLFRIGCRASPQAAKGLFELDREELAHPPASVRARYYVLPESRHHEKTGDI